MDDFPIYPAIFTYEPEGISVAFPDLPGLCTCGEDDADALRMAKEGLELHLFGLEQDGEPIPVPTPANMLHVGDHQVVVLVQANMPLARRGIQNVAVKKTLTIPQWLNELAEKEHVNFSQVLQSALKEALGLSDDKPRRRSA
ncbi:MAG: type II toxin-antitoxin system HicB family antitoxin [Armatimonadota bacterium]